MASIRVAKAIQRIKEEIVAGLKVWVEEWDPEVANPPIDLKTGLPILDEIPSRTPGRPTLRFLAGLRAVLLSGILSRLSTRRMRKVSRIYGSANPLSLSGLY